MKEKKRFQIQTAIQTGCKSPGRLVCLICKKSYVAGIPPSMFIYYELNHCNECYTRSKGLATTAVVRYHTHCSWLCSDICTELWMMKEIKNK